MRMETRNQCSVVTVYDFQHTRVRKSQTLCFLLRFLPNSAQYLVAYTGKSKRRSYGVQSVYDMFFSQHSTSETDGHSY